MKSYSLTHVLISLTDLTARNGPVQIVFRCAGDDKIDIDKAAKALGISSSQFIRMVTMQAARKILAELPLHRRKEKHYVPAVK